MSIALTGSCSESVSCEAMTAPQSLPDATIGSTLIKCELLYIPPSVPVSVYPPLLSFDRAVSGTVYLLWTMHSPMYITRLDCHISLQQIILPSMSHI